MLSSSLALSLSLARCESSFFKLQWCQVLCLFYWFVRVCTGCCCCCIIFSLLQHCSVVVMNIANQSMQIFLCCFWFRLYSVLFCSVLSLCPFVSCVSVSVIFVLALVCLCAKNWKETTCQCPFRKWFTQSSIQIRAKKEHTPKKRAVRKSMSEQNRGKTREKQMQHELEKTHTHTHPAIVAR